MASSKKDRQVILQILNYHVDAAPKIEVEPDDYVSYFMNELGEQWIFIRRHGEDHGTLYGGDIGWEAHEVRERTMEQVEEDILAQGARRSVISQLMAMTRPDPLVPTLVLQEQEKVWLNVCWSASSDAFMSEEERERRTEELAAMVVGQTPTTGFDQHPNTTDNRVAHQTLALLIGRAAGMRGLNDDATMKLYSAALRLANERAK